MDNGSGWRRQAEVQRARGRIHELHITYIVRNIDQGLFGLRFCGLTMKLSNKLNEVDKAGNSLKQRGLQPKEAGFER
jgi:hypothetical protein